MVIKHRDTVIKRRGMAINRRGMAINRRGMAIKHRGLSMAINRRDTATNLRDTDTNLRDTVIKRQDTATNLLIKRGHGYQSPGHGIKRQPMRTTYWILPTKSLKFGRWGIKSFQDDILLTGELLDQNISAIRMIEVGF